MRGADDPRKGRDDFSPTLQVTSACVDVLPRLCENAIHERTLALLVGGPLRFGLVTCWIWKTGRENVSSSVDRQCDRWHTPRQPDQ